MWSFRNFIYDVKDFKDGKEADEYFKQVYLELEEAYKNGSIKRDKRVLSIFTNYFDKYDFIPIIKKTFYSAYYSATYKDMKFYYIRMDDKENVSKLFNTYSNSEVNSNRYNTSFKIFNFLLKIYKNVFPILAIVGLVIYINLLYKFIFRKDRNIVFFISTLILVSYFSLLFIMSYTDVISFETIMPYYLVPIYSLQVLFIMILLLSKCEEIKLWKR